MEEDEDGLIEASIADIIEKSKRKRHADKIGVRLGMMRHMNVIVDCSEAMQDQDLKPTRHLCTLKVSVYRHFAYTFLFIFLFC